MTQQTGFSIAKRQTYKLVESTQFRHYPIDEPQIFQHSLSRILSGPAKRPAQFAGNNGCWKTSFKSGPLPTFISHEKAGKRMAANNDELLLTAAAVAHSGEALVIFDAKGAIVSANPAFTQITGYDHEEALGRTLDELLNSPTGRHNSAFFQKILDSLITTGQWKGEIWAKHKNGKDFPVLLSLDVIQDGGGRVTNHVGVFTDITRLKQYEEALKNLALHDALTGLPNRSLLMDRGQHALLTAERHGRIAAVLFIDLDLFKSVNDTHGHAMGDELLKLIAQRLLACTRDIDTVARLGGDEFAVVLTELAALDAAAIVAQKIVAQLSKPLRVNGLKLVIGASVGIASYPLNGTDMPTLLQHADEHLYRAKKSGGNKYSM